MNINTHYKAQQTAELGPAPWIREKAVKGAVDRTEAKGETSQACQVKAQDKLVDFQAILSASTKQAAFAPPETRETKVETSSAPPPLKTFEGYHLAPEKQAEMMAENHQSLTGVRDSYERMSADSAKAQEEMRQIRAEINLSISEVWSKAREKRVASQANHFEAWLQLFSKTSDF